VKNDGAVVLCQVLERGARDDQRQGEHARAARLDGVRPPANEMTAGAAGSQPVAIRSEELRPLAARLVQLTEVEQAFKEIKNDLAIRPIFHKTEERIEAHIFVAFLACCLQVTLKAKLRALAGGTTPREVLGKFKTMQMVDVHLPTTDGRELTLSRYTQPEAEHRMLLDQLRLSLPCQPPPKVTVAQARQATAELIP
jgi:hypothetical protein